MEGRGSGRGRGPIRPWWGWACRAVPGGKVGTVGTVPCPGLLPGEAPAPGRGSACLPGVLAVPGRWRGGRRGRGRGRARDAPARAAGRGAAAPAGRSAAWRPGGGGLLFPLFPFGSAAGGTSNHGHLTRGVLLEEGVGGAAGLAHSPPVQSSRVPRATPLAAHECSGRVNRGPHGGKERTEKGRQKDRVASHPRDPSRKARSSAIQCSQPGCHPPRRQTATESWAAGPSRGRTQTPEHHDGSRLVSLVRRPPPPSPAPAAPSPRSPCASPPCP